MFDVLALPKPDPPSPPNRAKESQFGSAQLPSTACPLLHSLQTACVFAGRCTAPASRHTFFCRSSRPLPRLLGVATYTLQPQKAETFHHLENFFGSECIRQRSDWLETGVGNRVLKGRGSSLHCTSRKSIQASIDLLYQSSLLLLSQTNLTSQSRIHHLKTVLRT